MPKSHEIKITLSEKELQMLNELIERDSEILSAFEKKPTRSGTLKNCLHLRYLSEIKKDYVFIPTKMYDNMSKQIENIKNNNDVITPKNRLD